MALPWPGSTALLLLWICCTAGKVRNCDYLHILNGRAYGNEPATSFPKSLGDKHYYRCDPGFLPPNKAHWQTIICTRYGWDPEPNCFKKCEHTEPITNGRFIYGSWTSPFIEGNTIFFSCDEGYNPLDESATATCTKDGWSPPPSCVTLADATCREPPLVDNADIVEERADSYLPGHELHYQCHEGFEISGSDTIRCENKKWSTPPRCEDMRCPTPPAIPNGQLNGAPKPRYLPSEKVKYRCLPSYSLFGPYTAMCLKREWINIPECRGCGLLAQFHHGKSAAHLFHNIITHHTPGNAMQMEVALHCCCFKLIIEAKRENHCTIPALDTTGRVMIVDITLPILGTMYEDQ